MEKKRKHFSVFNSILTGMLAITLFSYCSKNEKYEVTQVLSSLNNNYPTIHKQKNNSMHKNVAVLLIDMQDHFLNEIIKGELLEEIGYQINVLDYCNKNGVPIYVLEYKGEGKTTEILKSRIDSLSFKQYIIKYDDNGFLSTSLRDDLK